MIPAAWRSAFKRVDWLDAALIGAGLALTLIVRAGLLSHETRDYVMNTGVWYALIKERGFSAFAENFADYPPLYLYLQYLMTVAAPTLDANVAIKLISMPFDFLCAWWVFKLARLKYPGGGWPLVLFFAVLFAPTVVLNSAMWGQADAIYTAGVLACIYFAITRRPAAAFIALGLAFSIKVQAVFLAPWLAVLWLRRSIRLRYALLVPIVFVLSVVPAWLAGRPLLDLLTLYVGQANRFLELTMNLPNLYAWLPNRFFGLIDPVGVWWAAAICFLYVLVFSRRRAPLPPAVLIQLAVLSLLIVPYTLPRMHERYFFPAEVLSLAYVAFFPDWFAVPVVIFLSSLFPYIAYLFGATIMPPAVLAVAMLGVIAALTWQAVRDVARADAARSAA